MEILYIRNAEVFDACGTWTAFAYSDIDPEVILELSGDIRNLYNPETLVKNVRFMANMFISDFCDFCLGDRPVSDVFGAY